MTWITTILGKGLAIERKDFYFSAKEMSDEELLGTAKAIDEILNDRAHHLQRIAERAIRDAATSHEGEYTIGFLGARMDYLIPKRESWHLQVLNGESEKPEAGNGLKCNPALGGKFGTLLHEW